MEAVDFDNTVVAVLRAIRGRCSQETLSQKLGFTYNQIYRWESLRRKVNWLEFLDIARVRKRSVDRAMKLGLNTTIAPERYDLLIKSLIGHDSIKAVADRMSIATDQVSRWMQRKSVPSLAAMLKLIALKSDRLTPFLAHFIDLSTLPAFKELFERDSAICFLKAQYPELMLVLYVLHLSQYRSLAKHDDQWIASRLRLPKQRVAAICEESARLGILKKEAGLWKLQQEAEQEISSVYTSLAQRLELKKFLLEKHIAALSVPEAFESRDQLKLRASHFLFTTNQKAYSEISRLSESYYSDVLEIIRKSESNGEPHDSIVAMNLNFIDLLEFAAFQKSRT